MAAEETRKNDFFSEILSPDLKSKPITNTLEQKSAIKIQEFIKTQNLKHDRIITIEVPAPNVQKINYLNEFQTLDS